jgi:hypothetical protein
MADEYTNKIGDETLGVEASDEDVSAQGEHTELDDTIVSGPVLSFQPGADFSLIDVFREELRELSETRDVYIPIKGYERIGLQVRYHMPNNGKELAVIAQKVQREVKDVWSRNLFTAMDTMIYLCDGLYVQPEDVPEPVMLDPQETGMPMMFDPRLAEMMNLNGEVRSARQVVRKLFGGNDMAVINHAERLQRWLQNTKADLEAELWQLGE